MVAPEKTKTDDDVCRKSEKFFVTSRVCRHLPQQTSLSSFVTFLQAPVQSIIMPLKRGTLSYLLTTITYCLNPIQRKCSWSWRIGQYEWTMWTCVWPVSPPVSTWIARLWYTDQRRTRGSGVQARQELMPSQHGRRCRLRTIVCTVLYCTVP